MFLAVSVITVADIFVVEYIFVNDRRYKIFMPELFIRRQICSCVIDLVGVGLMSHVPLFFPVVIP